jgi:hypothetical protein
VPPVKGEEISGKANERCSGHTNETMVAYYDELCNHVFPSRQIEIGVKGNSTNSKNGYPCVPIPGLGRFIN